MPHNRKRLAVGIVAAALIGAGVAYASIPDAQGVIHACYDTQSGQTRIVDTAANALPKACGKTETPIAWNQSGPQGPQGLPGPQGPVGPTGAQGPPGAADAFAGINSDGTVNPNVSYRITQANVTHPRTGVYCISGLGLTPKVGFGTGWNGLTTDPDTGEVVSAAFDTLVSVAVAIPGSGSDVAGAGCPAGNQVRITTYRVSANALLDRSFYVMLDD